MFVAWRNDLKGRIRSFRDYQEKALNDTALSLQEGISRQLLVWSTGLGKTVYGAAAHDFIYPGEPSLFIVDRIELAKQTRDTFRAVNPDVRIGIEMNSSYARKDDNVVVLSVDTWGKAGNKRIEKFGPDYFKKIFVDEAHTAPTQRYDRVLNYFGVSETNLKDDRLLVGMTATPNRPDGVGLSKNFDDITANYDLIWAIKNGWLVEPVWYPVQTDTDISEVGTRGTELNARDLSLKINVASRNEQIVKAYYEYSRGERSIVFCGSVKHAYELAEYFKAYKIPAAAISAKTSTEDRKKYIDAFHAGEILVLCNFGVLTTGFDATEIDSIIHARPMKSDLLFRQASGRGFRPSIYSLVDLCSTVEQRLKAIENSPKPFCKLIDMQDIRHQHDVVSVPQLFGLNEEVQAQGKRMFKDVYEPLKEMELKHGIDIGELRSIDEIPLKVAERERISIRSLEVPNDIKKMSKYSWVEIGKEKYEHSIYAEGVSFVVKTNTIDRWDLYEVNLDTAEERKMNEHGFASSQGAINIADQYAEKSFGKKSMEYNMHKDRWRKKGVSDKQFDLIRKCFKPEIKKGIIKIDDVSEYKDSEIPHIYCSLNGNRTLLNRGTARELLGNFFTNQKRKRAKKKHA